MTDQPSERDVRRAVVDRYGARARAALEAAGAATVDAACCAPAPAGPVKLAFVDLGVGAACDPNDPDCDAIEGGAVRYGTANYDPAADLAGLPASVTGASLGCGNPIAIAELAVGERVLDLGSGGGIDCFLAAQRVGEHGSVWGLDMTPDMIALARHNAEQLSAQQVGMANVRFRLGEIEDIPFAEAAFDVVMSNCVINLSTDKPRVFREAFRVLAPGGRLRVSDMVWTRAPAAETRADLEQWAGCVAGALLLDDYLAAIRAAGFVDVDARYEPSERGLVSAAVFARRPA
ncbi:MAG: methyltransferase domain-containing protein [Dehalococcoidia bacterium]|nr:methyltransferase domain-containing protein [Dehalococcoidia bacterium]